MTDALPRQASWWDHSRNTSATFQPLPNALPDLERALAHFRRTQPELVAWIEEGHPRLTEDEHFTRFGEHYGGKSRRRNAAKP